MRHPHGQLAQQSATNNLAEKLPRILLAEDATEQVDSTPASLSGR